MIMLMFENKDDHDYAYKNVVCTANQYARLMIDMVRISSVVNMSIVLLVVYGTMQYDPAFYV